MKILSVLHKKLIFGALSLLLITSACHSRKDSSVQEADEIAPAFSEYVTALTSGVISSESSIKVILASNSLRLDEKDGAIEEEIFSFEPKIEGSTRWLDYRTVEFIPNQKLTSGQYYKVKLKLHKLVKVAPEFENLDFSFTTIEQNYAVIQEGLSIYPNKTNRYFLKGNIKTSDVADNEQIEKLLSAQQEGKELPISWIHGENRKEHSFIIDSISRKNTLQKIDVKWNGECLGVSRSGSVVVEVPAIGDFKVLSAKVYQYPNQHVEIQFSDPLGHTSKSIEGLIYCEEYKNFSFSIDENTVRAYPSSKLTGKHTLIIEEDVKNSFKDRLKDDYEKTLTFTDIKPAVELIGDGVIMPNSEGLTFPFKAVNLSAVDVSIIKIYESNIAQFLQVNKLDGIKELRRVGRQVYQQKIDLKSSTTVDFSEWNTYSLDLSKLIKTDPGSLYRVTISFKKSYSLYGCQDSSGEDSEEEVVNWDEPDKTASENSSWDYYDEYYDDSYYSRDNPCDNAYYHSGRFVSRNVLSSNLGIIAKMDKQKNFTVTVTDLKTLEPQGGVEVELYSYQNQLLTSQKTNSDGMATLTSKIKPFLLIAKKGDERGFVRLFEGSALSLTWFDVGGSQIQKGIKGFIYGERGVWRPGDSLYINFILEDKQKLIPFNHPVSFELINPYGQVSDKQIKTTGVNGFYHFKTLTDDEAPTGNWLARVKVGGAIFEKSLKIETVKPNRLKIKIDFGVDKLSAASDYIQGKLDLKWLHGAVAGDLNAQVTMTLSQVKTNFGKYADFIFDDPSRDFSTQEDVIFNRSVNSEGMANISADIHVRDAAPGMLRADFKTIAFEESGDYSIDQFSLPYSPYSTYVGIKVPKGDAARNMLLTDTKHKVNLLTVNENGDLVARKNLDVKIYQLNWRWWWDTSEDNLGNYSGNEHHNSIFETTASTGANGMGSFEFEVKYPSWGRYLIKVSDESGHSTGKIVYIDWPGWAGKSRDMGMGSSSILTLATDKAKYNVGETAEITLPEAPNGRALISIESGSKIIESHWATTSKERTVFKLPITEAMSPNVFINVTLLQPHSKDNDAPLRLYGYTPIMVEDPQTKLEPVIDMPDELSAESEVTIKVSEKSKKQMTYTLAVVDEGLLDLTRYSTPDPRNHFYAREALGISTWDMYDMVMGGYGGHVEKVFGIGGGGFNAEGRKKADRFKPVVIYMGPFTLDVGDKNTHTFKMPKYIGSVKAMVVAGYNGAYGKAEKAVPVKNPLMVLATLPRVLSPGETVKLPVTVFAMDKKVKDVKVSVKTNDLISITESTKNLKFSKTGEQIVDFGLKVNENLGVAEVEVLVESGNYKADYKVEIQVSNPNPFVTDLIHKVIEPGQTWNADFTLPGMGATNSATLEVTNLPPINLNKQMKYLIKYPHGCIEQTTSSVFPQLYLDKVTNLTSEQKAEIEKNIKAGIKRLHSFQLSSGGLGYWPEASSASDWGTSYAGHFLIEAEKLGYDLPSGLKSNWIKYQKSEAKNWSKNNSYIKSDLIQAYRLYTMALAGEEDYSAMNRLRESGSLSQQAKWRLAAAYAIAGRPEKGLEVVENTTTDIAEYNEMSNSFGSSLRDKGMILEALVNLKKTEDAVTLLESISADLNSNKWYSTQTTAYCLIGISQFVKSSGDSNVLKFEYSLNNGDINSIETGKRISSTSLGVRGTTKGSITVNNPGTTVLYARVVMEGQPLIDNSETSNNNLKMFITYKDMDGNTINPDKLTQGTDFKAEITVSNPGAFGDYENMALSTVFPSGWEIHNTRLNDAASAHTKDVPTYQDIRDDRVYTYFDLPANARKTFVVLLNAAYLGKFYQPTTYCEAMYDAKISARKAGGWVQIMKNE